MMEIQKIVFRGMLVLMPVTAAMAAVTGVVYRDLERCKDEIRELRRMHISSPKTDQLSSDSHSSEGIIVPNLPDGSAPVIHKGRKPSSHGTPSAKTEALSGNNIQLIDAENNPEEKTRDGIVLVGDE